MIETMDSTVIKNYQGKIRNAHAVFRLRMKKSNSVLQIL